LFRTGLLETNFLYKTFPQEFPLKYYTVPLVDHNRHLKSFQMAMMYLMCYVYICIF